MCESLSKATHKYAKHSWKVARYPLCSENASTWLSSTVALKLFCYLVELALSHDHMQNLSVFCEGLFDDIVMEIYQHGNNMIFT